MKKFLIAGLGNIGPEYSGTRHNVGFDIADAFTEQHKSFFSTERLAMKAEVKLKGNLIVVIKPTTYMNLSGRAVRYWVDKEHIAMQNVLVILDDVALPLSKIRLRASGSSAGHNGLKSIEEVLQTREYARLRFGIGSDYPKGRQVDFVLSRWRIDEVNLVQKKIMKCVEVIEIFVLEGVEKAMNEANKLEFML